MRGLNLHRVFEGSNQETDTIPSSFIADSPYVEVFATLKHLAQTHVEERRSGRAVTSSAGEIRAAARQLLPDPEQAPPECGSSLCNCGPEQGRGKNTQKFRL